MKMSYHTSSLPRFAPVAPEVNAKALASGKQHENDARTLFEFTSGVNVIESPIIYRTKVCVPPALPMVYAVTAMALS